MEGVQKAQTKRWLLNEYGTMLAAELEDRLDEVCKTGRLEALARSMQAFV